MPCPEHLNRNVKQLLGRNNRQIKRDNQICSSLLGSFERFLSIHITDNTTDILENGFWEVLEQVKQAEIDTILLE